ncbi:MAG: RNA polymerase sigma factor [Patescibacteria group bacterium]
MNFNKLYKSYFSPLTRFVFKKIGSDPYNADIIIHETFEAAWKGYKTFKHKSSFFTWLCRIALNKIADYYRDQINRRSHLIVPTLKKLSQIESKDIPIEEKVALDELRNKVNEVLNLLPEDKRKLLQYKFYRDLSYKEISVKLHISPRAVEGKIYRAKKAFAKLFS